MPVPFRGAELIDHLDHQDNRQGYIKKLIRDDMERRGG